jgi:hypothetical protein
MIGRQKIISIATVMGVIIAFVSLVYPIVYEKKKELSYEITATSLNFGKEVDDLRLVLFDRVIVNGWISKVKITNSGGIPIEEKDFAEPIVIHPQNGIKVIGCKVAAEAPDNLNIKLNCINDMVIIQGRLLNPGDNFSVNIVSDGEGAAFTPKVRISGISDMTNREDPSKRVFSISIKSRSLYFLGLISAIGLASMLGIYISVTQVWGGKSANSSIGIRKEFILIFMLSIPGVPYIQFLFWFLDSTENNKFPYNVLIFLPSLMFGVLITKWFDSQLRKNGTNS